MSLYRDIIREAWRFTKARPWLWLLGLFAAVASNAREVNTLMSGYSPIENIFLRLQYSLSLMDVSSLGDAWNNTLTNLSANVGGTILATIVLLLVALIVIWLVIVSQAVIITGAAWSREAKTQTAGALFREGRQFFAPLLLINLYAFLIILVPVALAALPTFLRFARDSTISVSFGANVVAYLFLIPIGIIVSFIARYASAFVILEGARAHDAIRHGWNLFVRNWLISLEVAAILFLINLAVSFALAVFLVFTGLITASGGWFLLGSFAVLGALIAVFQFSSWTLLFLDLRKSRVSSKLVRWFAKGSLKSR